MTNVRNCGTAFFGKKMPKFFKDLKSQCSLHHILVEFKENLPSGNQSIANCRRPIVISVVLTRIVTYSSFASVWKSLHHHPNKLSQTNYWDSSNKISLFIYLQYSARAQRLYIPWCVIMKSSSSCTRSPPYFSLRSL